MTPRRFVFHWITASLAVAALTLRPASAAPITDARVVGVSLLPAPGRADLVIRVEGSVQIQDAVIPGTPVRLVVDLRGARLGPGPLPRYDGVVRAGIRNIRLGQYQPDIVRVVIELDRERPYTVEREEGGVRVALEADQEFLAWSTGAASAPAATVEGIGVVPVADVEAGRAPVVAAARVDAPRLRQQAQEPRITVEWDRADIHDVIAAFAALSGRTIIPGKDISGTVTASIKDQPWTLAFQAILATQGLSAREMAGGIIRVDSPKALAQLDSLEPLETRVIRLNYARAGALSGAVETILTKDRGRVYPDTATNSLIITDTRSRIADVEGFVRGLDIRTPQVSIQAKIIFVDRTDIEQLGIKYDLGSRTQFFNKLVQRPDPFGEPGSTYNPNVNIIDLGGGAVSAIANASSDISGSALDLIFSTALGGFTLTSFLSALERVELSDVQAEPTITTLDNRQADILVGEEVPVRVVDLSSPVAGGTGVPRATVQFKETGIRLTVTPHVTHNRQILMDLKTERSNVRVLTQADLGYLIDKQQTTNQLLVNDGETAVIGGLTVTTVTRSRSGIPLLSSLPLIGGLFSFTNNSENRKDLLILVTPRIVDESGAGGSPGF
jgi:type IV pilus assembly protein PilQ